MIILFIAISLVTIFALTRIISLKRELKKINAQLQLYNNRKTDKKIDLALLDKDLEHLGIEINRLIDLYVTEYRRRIRFEEEQRQAIANISHDLRTPLTSIKGYIQMAQDENITEEEREKLLSIANNRAKRLETLIREFFELSVIESPDYKLKSERINLKNIVTNVLLSFFDRFNEKNLEPEINIPEQDIIILSDESAITRVVENLVSNAITHSDGNIVISLEKKDSTVSLIVKNDAYSLTEKDVERMFDRFYMADQSRTGKSTGLGLSIVKSLMENTNGKITGHLMNRQLSIICEWEIVESN